MKDKLKQYCSEIGIDHFGIVSTGPYVELENTLKERIEKGFFTGFEEKDLEKRIYPRLTMEDAHSIIVCLFPYFTGYKKDGNISNYTYARDYHITVKEKLTQIGEFLSGNIEDFKYMAFVDTGPLVDRYLAWLAGVGFYGINNHIITDKYGSYVFIGYIMTNYPFEFDLPQQRTCLKCGNCVRSCPGGAILGGFELDPRRCVSYLTQKKGDLSEDERRFIKNNGHSVFGCDICQKVCPHNKAVEETNLEEFSVNLMHRLNRFEISSISNKEFKRRYGDRAFSWRGRPIIERNFSIIEEEHYQEGKNE